MKYVASQQLFWLETKGDTPGAEGQQEEWTAAPSSSYCPPAKTGANQEVSWKTWIPLALNTGSACCKRSLGENAGDPRGGHSGSQEKPLPQCMLGTHTEHRHGIWPGG